MMRWKFSRSQDIKMPQMLPGLALSRHEQNFGRNKPILFRVSFWEVVTDQGKRGKKKTKVSRADSTQIEPATDIVAVTKRARRLASDYLPWHEGAVVEAQLEILIGPGEWVDIGEVYWVYSNWELGK